MMTRYQVWLNGEALDQLAPGVCILDVREEQPEMDVRTEEHVQRHGQRLMRRMRLSLSVTVLLAVRETDPALRSMVIGSIHRWMRRGGVLWISSRPGQQLMAVPEQLPVSASLDDWTETLTAVFTAYELPFWQDRAAVTVSLGAGEEKTVYVPGTAEDTLCEASVTAKGSAACQQLSITAGRTRFRFEQLALMPGETLRCTYDEQARLRLVIRACDGTERSAARLRTADSHDELLLACGMSEQVRVEADVPVQAVLSARGCWL